MRSKPLRKTAYLKKNRSCWCYGYPLSHKGWQL